MGESQWGKANGGKPMGETSGRNQWEKPMGETNGRTKWEKPMGKANGNVSPLHVGRLRLYEDERGSLFPIERISHFSHSRSLPFLLPPSHSHPPPFFPSFSFPLRSLSLFPVPLCHPSPHISVSLTQPSPPTAQYKQGDGAYHAQETNQENTG